MNALLAAPLSVMVVLGTTIHEFASSSALVPF
jgi:hypothetical protein